MIQDQPWSLTIHQSNLARTRTNDDKYNQNDKPQPALNIHNLTTIRYRKSLQEKTKYDQRQPNMNKYN